MLSAQGWLDNNKPKDRKCVETFPKKTGLGCWLTLSGDPVSIAKELPQKEEQVERGEVKMPHPVMTCSNYCSSQLGAVSTGESRTSSLIYWTHLLLETLHPSSLHFSHFAFTDDFYLCKNIFFFGQYVSPNTCFHVQMYFLSKLSVNQNFMVV